MNVLPYKLVLDNAQPLASPDLFPFALGPIVFPCLAEGESVDIAPKSSHVFVTGVCLEVGHGFRDNFYIRKAPIHGGDIRIHWDNLWLDVDDIIDVVAFNPSDSTVTIRHNTPLCQLVVESFRKVQPVCISSESSTRAVENVRQGITTLYANELPISVDDNAGLLSGRPLEDFQPAQLTPSQSPADVSLKRRKGK